MASAAGKLAGKRALISGANSGTARAAAARFVAEGATVGLIARREDVLNKVASSLGDRAMPLAADVADDRAIAEAVSKFSDRYGGVDIVVNAAAIDGPAALKDLTPEIWRRQLEVNLSGTFFLTREGVLRMNGDGGGVVINFGSELGLVGMALMSHYCASKFGVIGLTKALAAELAPKVRVNCICPGPIDTPGMDAELNWYPDPEASRKAAIDRVPLKRFATVEEIAEVVLFFASDATFATGSIFSIDGGTTAV